MSEARPLLAESFMRTSIGALIAAAIAMAGCGRGAESRPATTVTTAAETGGGPRRLENDDAAMVVTRARCQHEASCGIGTDDDACRRHLMPRQAEVLRDETCPAGVDEQKLTQCVDQILGQRCAGRRAEASTSGACRATVLCASPARP